MLNYSSFPHQTIALALDDFCSLPQRVIRVGSSEFDKQFYENEHIYWVFQQSANLDWARYTVFAYPAQTKIHCYCRKFNSDPAQPLCPHVASVIWYALLDHDDGDQGEVQGPPSPGVPDVKPVVKAEAASASLDKPTPFCSWLGCEPLAVSQMRYLVERRFGRYDPNQRRQADRVSARVEDMIERIDSYLYDLEH